MHRCGWWISARRLYRRWNVWRADYVYPWLRCRFFSGGRNRIVFLWGFSLHCRSRWIRACCFYVASWIWRWDILCQVYGRWRNLGATHITDQRYRRINSPNFGGFRSDNTCRMAGPAAVLQADLLQKIRR